MKVSSPLLLSILALLVFAAFGIYILHVFRPWMKTDSTIQVNIDTSKFGSWEFEIWQRKNSRFLEPFTSALFVRPTNSPSWLAFSLSHQDMFQPQIKLVQFDSIVCVMSDNNQLGYFLLTNGNYYTRGATKPSHEGFTANPRGWWSLSNEYSVLCLPSNYFAIVVTEN
jgi:hypothetical protein